MNDQETAKLATEIARRLEIIEEQISELRSVLAALRSGRPITRPPVREMVLSVMRYADSKGLTRSEMLSAIRRDYGTSVSDNTLTGTLSRMHVARLIRREGHVWFLR